MALLTVASQPLLSGTSPAEISWAPKTVEGAEECRCVDAGARHWMPGCLAAEECCKMPGCRPMPRLLAELAWRWMRSEGVFPVWCFLRCWLLLTFSYSCALDNTAPSSLRIERSCTRSLLFVPCFMNSLVEDYFRKPVRKKKETFFRMFISQ